ncbi:Crp/Fnr family transcriptional regulator [Cytobacillus sp. Hz8]|uniref:Crp/Fnr family transcriptional regulator n=1 Tax=Cytobacillus sp. Hz8 TaxID=3347168 RepID=UPI0035D9129E
MFDEVVDPHIRIIKKSNIEEFLGKIKAFKDLSKESIRLLDKRIQKLKFKKGEILFTEFDEARGVFFVDHGIVKLTKLDENGNEIIVCIKKEGEIFAEACLFNEQMSNYPATATMVQAGEIFFLNTEKLEQELLHSPELGVRIIHYMSEALRDMTLSLRDVTMLDVQTKTIKTLEKLARKFGERVHNEVHVELPVTVQEFASLVGSSRESVSRVFSKLKKEGIIVASGKKIIIPDWNHFCSLTTK